LYCIWLQIKFVWNVILHALQSVVFPQESGGRLLLSVFTSKVVVWGLPLMDVFLTNIGWCIEWEQFVYACKLTKKTRSSRFFSLLSASLSADFRWKCFAYLIVSYDSLLWQSCLKILSFFVSVQDLPPERAFADFVLCNLVLHLVIMNFLGWFL
jgi:hypothetical protein